MALHTWQEFKLAFNYYLSETVGLFTVEEPMLEYFNLDQFLKRQHYHAINNRDLSMMQVEMLMALSAFIDIQESAHNIRFDILPEEIIIYMKILIQNNRIGIHPASSIKNGCINHMDIEEIIAAVAA